MRLSIHPTPAGVSAGWILSLGLVMSIAAMFPREASAQAAAGQTRVRPRVIATTDGEIDDRCSMVRFLMYANEWDVEGLIYSSSRFHWLGQTWSGIEWINSQIDQYARVYDHLKQHADGYPTPEELKRVVYVGNISNVGEMEQESPGGDRIVRVLLDDKPGLVYLQAWGGTNTIAKALSKIQKEHPDKIEKVNQKAVVYIILDQDETFRKYIEPNWPKLQVLGSFRQFGALAYAWSRLIPPPQRVFFERPWLEGNITINHGSLAGAYEPSNGAFRSEGDSPSFMHQIEVGLRSLESPAYGGWGGRFVQEKPGVTNVWKNAEDDGNLFKPIWRWAEAFQNDWAVRADWCIKTYRDANHPPIVNLETPKGLEAAAGAVVKLSVKGSTVVKREERSYSGFYSARVVDTASSQQRILFTLWDADPGSGLRLGGRWSDDSEALRLKGETRGFANRNQRNEPFAFDLIYLVEDDGIFRVTEGG